MFEDYNEMYAEYEYSKMFEEYSYKELEESLQHYHTLIIEKDAEREKTVTKRLITTWVIATALIFAFLFFSFKTVAITSLFVFLLISILCSAFFIFMLIPSLNSWVYSKNIEDAYHLEKLKFRWLVVKKELETRKFKEAKKIIDDLDNELV